MSDEPQYSSDTNNNSGTGSKRKYDDQLTAPPPSDGRSRPTGFSSGPIPLDSGADAPPSYNTVPPPTDEINIYKQRAQEIAARLMDGVGGGVGAGAFDAKRPRVDNGVSGYDGEKGFNSAQSDFKPMSIPSGAAAVSYSSFQGSTKKIDVPNNRVGVIIGKGGETIKYLQLQSGSKIQVTRDMNADPGSNNRSVELMGTPEQIAKAEQLIHDVLAEKLNSLHTMVKNSSSDLTVKKKQDVKKTDKKNLGVKKDASSSKPKKSTFGAEIDQIFAGKKKKKQEKKIIEKKSVDRTERSKKVGRRLSEEKGDYLGDAPAAKTRRKTIDGFTIYTEEELGFNKMDVGSSAGACPFDCDCCF